MRTILLAFTLVAALVATASPSSAEDGPCAGTPQDHCAPVCDTGDLRDCIAWPVFPCIHVEPGVEVCP